MKKTTKRKTLMLLSSGMLVFAATQILARFTELSDATMGLGIGLGIGLVLTSIIFGDFKTA